MTTILLVILGVLLAAAAVLMVVYYGGDAFGNGRIEAEAGRLVTEGAQIEGAMELYYRQEGSYPRDADPIAQMIAAKYLTHAPLGTRTTEADKWSINYDAGMIRAKLGPLSDKDTKNICLKARQQLDLPAAGTSSGIYRCDGTDSPGGKLGGREPCCIGPVGVGGGPADTGPVLPTRAGTTTAQCADYIMAFEEYVAYQYNNSDGRYIASPAALGITANYGSCATRMDYEDRTNGQAVLFSYNLSSATCNEINNRIGNTSGISTNVQHSCGDYRYAKNTVFSIKDYRSKQVALIRAEYDKILAAAKTAPGIMPTTTSNLGYAPNFKGNGEYEPDNASFQFSGGYLNSGQWQARIFIRQGVCNALRTANGDPSYETRPNIDLSKEDCGNYYQRTNYIRDIGPIVFPRVFTALMQENTGTYTTSAWTSRVYNGIPMRQVDITDNTCRGLKKVWGRDPGVYGSPINYSTAYAYDCGFFYGTTRFVYRTDMTG